MLEAIWNAGAGGIGNYSSCSFNIKGTGTFLPEKGRPVYWEAGKLERVEEIRVETIVPYSVHRKAVQAMLKAHPYEEVAYDLYPMDLKGRLFGLGRVGKLQRADDASRAQLTMRRSFRCAGACALSAILNESIRKVAVLGGSGSRYIRHAMFAGADVLVTGDIDYHTAHDALAAGIAIIDPGHNIEKIMKRRVAEWLD